MFRACALSPPSSMVTQGGKFGECRAQCLVTHLNHMTCLQSSSYVCTPVPHASLHSQRTLKAHHVHWPAPLQASGVLSVLSDHRHCPALLPLVPAHCLLLPDCHPALRSLAQQCYCLALEPPELAHSLAVEPTPQGRLRLQGPRPAEKGNKHTLSTLFSCKAPSALRTR